MAFAGAFRKQNLPSFCETVFPKLVPGLNRPLSAEETRNLILMTGLSQEGLDARLSAMRTGEKRDLLEKLMLLHWQIPFLAAEEIPSESRLEKEELLNHYPKARGLMGEKPEMQEKLNRAYLKRKVWKSAETVAAHLGSEARPEERRELFKTLLDHVDFHDQSWHHQATIDSLIDLASGIQTKKISQEIQKKSRREFNDLHQGEETYSFAGPELLLTPYSEILNLFQAMKLKPGDTVVDLGAGFGRVGLALAVQYPGINITGYEIVKERVSEGARLAKEWNLDSRVHLIEQNLADPQFKPQAADVYYAFNPVSGSTFDKILEDLRVVGLQSGKKFRLIVFGPSPFFKTDAQPWLKEIKGSDIPEGEELKIYEFSPEAASHTVIVEPGKNTNPYELRPVDTVSTYPKTEVLSAKHSKTIAEHLARFTDSHQNDSSFLSPNYLVAWAAHWPMEISRHGNQLLISSQQTGEPGKESFVEPLGGTPEEKARLIKKVIEDRKKQGIKAEFSFVSAEVRKILESDPQVVTLESKEYDDFVYPAENLAKLDRSKKLRDRAHQADSFQKNNPEAKVEILSHLGEGEAAGFQRTTSIFLESWLANKKGVEQMSPFDRAQLETENGASKVLAQNLSGSRSVQMAVRGPVDEEGQRSIIAYAAGEIRENSRGKRTLIIYVQKSDGTKNAIPFINRELVREVYDHPEQYGAIDYVNMMDGSTSGLRQFKMQYEPDPTLSNTFRIIGAD